MSEKLDKDTQEILDEMKADGVMPEEEESQEEEEQDAPSQQEEEEEEDESSEESSAEDDESEAEEEPSEDEESDTSDDEEETEQSVNPYQEPKMSVKKHQKVKSKWKEKEASYQQRIKELESQVQSNENKNIENKVNELSETYGFDKDFVQGIIDTVKETTPDVSKELETLRSERARAEQDNFYAKDFEANVNPILENDYPDITQAQINKVKNELKKLKFTKELASVPLDYIFIRHKDKFDSIVNPKHKKTAEKSRVGTGGKQKVTDYSQLTPDDIKNMSDSEFDKYSEAMAKGQSRVTINKR